ncbi:MAG: DUF4422 domain-containing protein [[Pasteurella] aerogenes]|nr:DUF4422 domain-containing protein [[Pasteurella] aerogenes]
MLKINIIVATHKHYEMPSDNMYIPLHVGKDGKSDIGYIGDNTGEHISYKNPYFCELTGLYWAWKNLDCDYIGLIHYRRIFSIKKLQKRVKAPLRELYLSSVEAEKLLQHYDIIVPSKRRYWIETLYSHYAHTFHKEHLDVSRDIILEHCPEYICSFDRVMSQTSGYMFNMFIMRKELVNDYCSWLFDILFELENRISVEQYDSFHARFLGRVSEVLFNVWLDKKNIDSSIRVKSIPFVYGEKINWGRKILSFLSAKFLNKKYNKSF